MNLAQPMQLCPARQILGRAYIISSARNPLEPLAANGMPTEVTQENDFYVAAVQLRTDLKWTDGTSFTAEDVAFTVNTALSFELGYDWGVYYSRDYLHHAEAIDLATVKYYFKQKPNVGVWQYGALQGPIVQKAFWEKSVELCKPFARQCPARRYCKDTSRPRNCQSGCCRV